MVEYLQITGSVQHIVNLWTIHNRQKMTEKHVSEQRSLKGSRGPDKKASRAGCGPRAASWTPLL